mgnify:CR=1 FL=1
MIIAFYPMSVSTHFFWIHQGIVEFIHGQLKKENEELENREMPFELSALHVSRFTLAQEVLPPLTVHQRGGNRPPPQTRGRTFHASRFTSLTQASAFRPKPVPRSLSPSIKVRRLSDRAERDWG